MTTIVPLFRARGAGAHQAAETPNGAVGRFLNGFSIEVMPKTAAKVDDLAALLPAGTEVYVAHIDGTSIDDMRRTVARLSADGLQPTPHIPARLVADRATLDDWLAGYADLGARTALVLAGGVDRPRGAFDSSVQLLETGLFDARGFKRLRVAGHPEGNRDIDPQGGETRVFEALGWKKAFAERTDADMAVVTQFAFAAEPIVDWLGRLADAGLDLPVHIGIAGPAKLQTLVRYALLCGVGPSLRVLERRAADLTKLLTPFEPTELLGDLAAAAAEPEAPARAPIAGVHVFPLGGLRVAATYLQSMAAADAAAKAAG